LIVSIRRVKGRIIVAGADLIKHPPRGGGQECMRILWEARKSAKQTRR